MNVRDLILAYRTEPDNRRAVLEGAVKSFLDGPANAVEGAATLSTKELVERLWPENLAHGEDLARRAFVFRDLAMLETEGHFTDYVTFGERTINRYKQTIQPRRWHKPLRQRNTRLDQLERFDRDEDGYISPDRDGRYVALADVEKLFGGASQ